MTIEKFRIGNQLHIKAAGCVFRIVKDASGWAIYPLYSDVAAYMPFQTEAEAESFLVKEIEGISL